MRNLTTWIVSTVLVLGALSAVVAALTVQWLYPTFASPDGNGPLPGIGKLSAASGVSATKPPAGTPEHTAMELIRRAGAGDLHGALALVQPGAMTAEGLQRQVTRFTPTPRRVAALPGTGEPRLLVWVDYWRESGQARGLYQVSMAGGKVSAVQGLLAPEGGFAPLPWAPLEETGGKQVNLKAYRGRPLLLVAPRTPEVGLAEALTELRKAGLEVVLVIDTRSPDWVTAARHFGFDGPIWRLKQRMEDAGVVNQGQALGAVGVLIDADGVAVGPFAALDPLRYGLPDKRMVDILPIIMKAYGLDP